MLTQFRIEERDRFYYDQYEYAVTFRQPELGCLRERPTNEQLWRNINQRRHYRNIYGRGPDPFTAEIIMELEDTRQFLETLGDYKLVISHDFGTVYTNDVNAVQRCQDRWDTRCSDPRRALITKPRDTILLNEPKFQYRTYFRDRALPDNTERERFRNWINAVDKKEINLSGALRRWLMDERKYRISINNKFWLQRHYYVEHNSPQYTSMIGLMCPGWVRKTCSVVKRDK